VAASILAGLVGYAAIVWLVRIVRSGRLWYFSVYLILLGLAIGGYEPVAMRYFTIDPKGELHYVEQAEWLAESFVSKVQ